MANEFKHKDPGSELTQAEFIASDGTGHIFDSQAQGDVLYATSTTVLARLGKDANATRALTNTGTNNNPAWAQIALATGVSGTLPAGNGGTGITSLGSNVATFLGTPSSSNLASAVTGETGSGALVFGTSPTLVTPALGTPSALVGTNISGTAASLTAGAATALATARTIGGTCFDGTGNIAITTNANLTGVVTSSGNATAIADKALAIAKLADGTDGELITWNASGVIAAVAVGSADEVLTSNGSGAAPTFQAVGSSVSAATQAEQETGSSTAVFTSPGTQQYHDSALKAWARFEQIGTHSLTGNYNISCICDAGTGTSTLGFGTAFSGTNELVTIATSDSSHTLEVGPHAACNVEVRNLNDSHAAADSGQVLAAFMGDQ
jgi:hypothetical protein